MRDDLPTAAACGSWASPLSARAVATAGVGLGYATACDGRLYWIESRPAERGRSVLVAAAPGSAPADVTPAPGERALARARVRRAPVHGRRRPHRVLRVRRPDPLRARRGGSAARGDAPRLSLRGRRRGGRWPDTVHRARRSLQAGRARQRHRDARPRARVRRNRVVRRRGLRRLSAPRPERATGLRRVGPSEHAVGRDHAACRAPSAPTDSPTLRVVAGGPARPDESVLEPVWDADGTLYFLSDRSGYWNLFRFRDGAVEQVTALAADLGGPLWSIGAVDVRTDGRRPRAGAHLPRCRRQPRAGRPGDRGRVAAAAAVRRVRFDRRPRRAHRLRGRGARRRAAVVDHVRPARRRATHDPRGRPRGARGRVRFARRTHRVRDAARRDGAPRTAHAFFHAPRNPRFTAPSATKPPLIVMLHGGPTDHASPAQSRSIQFWTTRGFAVVNVNYGGSSGFGRAYRDRLLGEWGVVDLAGRRGRRRPPRRDRAHRRRARRHPRRQRRRLHGARRTGVHAALRGGHQLLRHRRPRSAGRGHAQVRKPLPGPADRAVARGPRRLSRAQSRSITWNRSTPR